MCQQTLYIWQKKMHIYQCEQRRAEVSVVKAMNAVAELQKIIDRLQFQTKRYAWVSLADDLGEILRSVDYAIPALQSFRKSPRPKTKKYPKKKVGKVIRCPRCETMVHVTKKKKHNCEFYRRNLSVTAAYRAIDKVRKAVKRAENVNDMPVWVITVLKEIVELLEPVGRELTTHRDEVRP
jgi:hypothetical protein